VKEGFCWEFFGTEFTDEMQEHTRGNISPAGFLVVDFFGMGSFQQFVLWGSTLFFLYFV